MTTIQKTCLICNSTFQAILSEHNRGNAKFCSRKCSAKNVANIIVAKKILNTTCAFCCKKFYLSESRKKNSKSGLHFCCRGHKDQAQQVASGIKQIQPSHYGTGHSTYRSLALREYGAECQQCGYDKFESVLQVHHKDKNRENNQIENLQVVCPTCHAEQHLVEGIVRYDKK